MSTRTRASSLISAMKALTPPSAEPDEALLSRFIADRADEPFHAIVRRHGGLVLDVCRSILRNHADAEDAFQAVFLILATRAGSVRNPAALAAWLHGTACRTARKARAAAVRRRVVESLAPASESVSAPDPSWAEVRAAIHEEVNRLPRREREAGVLCYLTGATAAGAAKGLELTKDGVKKRLESGREMLRAALTKRGFGPVAVLAGTIVLPGAAPAALAAATTELAIRVCSKSLVPVQNRVRTLVEAGTGSKLAAATMVLLVVATAFGFAMSASNDPPPFADRYETAQARTEPRPVEGTVSELDGTWKLVNVSDLGKVLPGVPAIEFRFREGKLELPGFDSERDHSPWNLSFLRSAKVMIAPTARTIDFKLTADVVNGVTLSGIYQIRKGRLKIAFRPLKAAGLPRPNGFLTSSGSIVTLTLEPIGDRR